MECYAAVGNFIYSDLAELLKYQLSEGKFQDRVVNIKLHIARRYYPFPQVSMQMHRTRMRGHIPRWQPC